MDTLIRQYVCNGFAYLEIIELLKRQHSYTISLSTLKRRLRYLGIKRRAVQSVRNPLQDVEVAVRNELSSSGSNIGYRRVHRSLVSQGYICRQADVRRIIKGIDPEGVNRRRRRRLHRRKYISPGPNFAWHIDGHDKLKPFGFSIHGCLDGFSRKILWLEVGPTNKMPEVVAKYYLDTVKHLGGVPVKLKADDGTEQLIS